MAAQNSLLDLVATTFSESAAGGSGRRRQARMPAEGEAIIHWVGEKGEFLQQAVELRDASRNGLGFLSAREFRVGQGVWFELRGELTRGVIRHCDRVGEGYRTGLVKTAIDRRREDRQPCNEIGTLEWGNNQSSPVFVRNVSEHGVQLEIPYQVPESSVVRLCFGAWQCLGSVCYCRLEGQAYLVGLNLVGKPTRQPRDSHIEFDRR